MGVYKDLTGTKFGRLTVIGMDKSTRGAKHLCWFCQCECGGFARVTTDNLTRGHTLSCGCVRKEHVGDSRRTHGLSGNRLFRIYYAMIYRCENKKSSNYNEYGGRGIRICKEWKADMYSFFQWALSHGYADNLSIDRINVNGNYEPSNCRWITNRAQCNNKRDNLYETIDGKTKTLSEWCQAFNLPYERIYTRLYRGWPLEKALGLESH